MKKSAEKTGDKEALLRIAVSVTSAKVVSGYGHFVCLYANRTTRVLSTKFDKTFWRVGYMTSNCWLDFGINPHHDMEAGIL